MTLDTRLRARAKDTSFCHATGSGNHASVGNLRGSGTDSRPHRIHEIVDCCVKLVGI